MGPGNIFTIVQTVLTSSHLIHSRAVAVSGTQHLPTSPTVSKFASLHQRTWLSSFISKSLSATNTGVSCAMCSLIYREKVFDCCCVQFDSLICNVLSVFIEVIVSFVFIKLLMIDTWQCCSCCPHVLVLTPEVLVLEKRSCLHRWDLVRSVVTRWHSYKLSGVIPCSNNSAHYFIIVITTIIVVVKWCVAMVTASSITSSRWVVRCHGTACMLCSATITGFPSLAVTWPFTSRKESTVSVSCIRFPPVFHIHNSVVVLLLSNMRVGLIK